MTNLRGVRVLVTGGSGLVGANLLRALLRDKAIVAATLRPSTNLWRIQELRSHLDLQFLDLAQADSAREIFERVRPNVVFHLAFSPGHPEEEAARSMMLQAGLIGTAALLEAAARLGVARFIQFGSSMEYGSKDRPLRETDPLRPNTFRGTVKAGCSLLCKHYARNHGLSVVILRIFSAYGPWEASTRLIPAAILAAMRGQSLPLTGPDVEHDFVYITDIVDACLKSAVMDGANLTELNIGSGKSSTNEAVVELVEMIVGRTLRVLPRAYPEGPADPEKRIADTRQARKILGWSPQVSLRRGIAKTHSWLQENHDRYYQPNQGPKAS